MRILAFLLCVIPLFASGEEIVLGMSQDEVAITATFDGSNILVFGAIKRESTIPNGDKRIWGWFFYDWACQPFYTLMLTFFFAPYFATVAADYFIASGMETEVSKAKAQTMWSICLSASGLL